jgi:hypothetical protein
MPVVASVISTKTRSPARASNLSVPISPADRSNVFAPPKATEFPPCTRSATSGTATVAETAIVVAAAVVKATWPARPQRRGEHPPSSPDASAPPPDLRVERAERDGQCNEEPKPFDASVAPLHELPDAFRRQGGQHRSDDSGLGTEPSCDQRREPGQEGLDENLERGAVASFTGRALLRFDLLGCRNLQRVGAHRLPWLVVVRIHRRRGAESASRRWTTRAVWTALPTSPTVRSNRTPLLLVATEGANFGSEKGGSS